MPKGVFTRSPEYKTHLAEKCRKMAREREPEVATANLIKARLSPGWNRTSCKRGHPVTKRGGKCAECQTLKKRTWAMNKVGWTPEMYERAVVTQENKCAVCHQMEVESVNGKRQALSADHDHESGKARELLCKRCNRVLGIMEDNPLLLDAAAAYLRKHRG